MSKEDDLFAEAMRTIATGDVRNARRMLRQAADAEHMPAMTIYAAYVEHGVGGNPNEHKALAYYRRAAQLGDPTACLRVAKWHSDRKQIPQAKFWLRKSCSFRAALARIRMDVKSGSCKTTEEVNGLLYRVHVRPEALTASERTEVEALIATRKRQTDIKKSREGRDKMREAKRSKQLGNATTVNSAKSLSHKGSR